MSIKYPDLTNTLYPDSEQQFPQMIDITVADCDLIAQYQNLIEQKNFAEAEIALKSIPLYDQKILTSKKLNTSFDTTIALQRFFNEKYSPAYIISETQPIRQENSDYWFKVVGTV